MPILNNLSLLIYMPIGYTRERERETETDTYSQTDRQESRQNKREGMDVGYIYRHIMRDMIVTIKKNKREGDVCGSTI